MAALTCSDRRATKDFDFILDVVASVIKTRSDDRINTLDRPRGLHQRGRCGVMIAFVLAVIIYCRAFFVGRHRLGLEIAALRQQLVVFRRKRPRPTYAIWTEHFGSPFAVCGRGGRMP